MNNTDRAAAYVTELEAEYTATKKCLERIPESLYDFKPHPKSMSMGYLVLLVAEIPLWIKHMVEESEIDFATFSHIQAKTTKEVTDHFDENFQSAKTALLNASDEILDGDFYLKNNGEVIYKMSKIVDIGSTINHWVHHRGQLTVYMRLNDIAVPSIYGPSADDKVF